MPCSFYFKSFFPKAWPNFFVEQRVFGQTYEAINLSNDIDKSLPNFLFLLKLFEEKSNEQPHLLFYLFFHFLKLLYHLLNVFANISTVACFLRAKLKESWPFFIRFLGNFYLISFLCMCEFQVCFLHLIPHFI